MQNKKTIFLVPHSHWDREWYFTFDTSNVLLHSNFVEFEKLDKKIWFMDGQWSLVDDLIKWKSNRFEAIQKALQNKKIGIGPLYSQPDVFNSQAETIIRNFEIGNKIANHFKIEQLKTAYLPDTFGFGENLPQILKHCKIENFIFWRGLNKDQLNKNDFFYWEGIDGTKIKSFVFRDGYFSLGSVYPYNEGNIYPEKKDPQNFLKKIKKVINNIKGNHKELILPLGGDQAPFMYHQDKFIDVLNQETDEYYFKIVSNYDDFMKSKKTNSCFKGNLRVPITGKIHRTITSSRYDIKKAFRDAEDKLYYLLEPLELFYKSKDKIYDFTEYKDENIIKPLLIAQSHDSLGGCNTDVTNRMQLNRIERVTQNIESQVDLLIKKVNQTKSIKDETISIFNPAPFKNDFFKVITIYSKNISKLNINNKNLIILSLSSKNISLKPNKCLYENKIVIIAKKLKPLSLKTFDIKKYETNFKYKSTKINKKDNKLILKLSNQKIIISLQAIQDKGDSYDFSPGKKIPLKIKWSEIEKTELGDGSFILIKGFINNSKFIIYMFKEKNNIKIKLHINNKFKNTRLSLNIEQEEVKPKIKKSLNLALTDFIKDDFAQDWKSKMKECPINVDVNDGIILLNNKINIFTKGNNEIYKTNKGIQITLYRTYGYVTRENLPWRQTTSGLSWKEKSPDSQLQKQLEFDFEISVGKTFSRYNSFKFEPYVYKNQTRHFIANKMTKFTINNIQKPLNKKLDVEIENKNIIISSIRSIGNKILIRVANMENKSITFYIKNSNQKYIFKLKKYEIKLIELKDG